MIKILSSVYMENSRHTVMWWVRHYATSWKVKGSIPNKVTGFFIWPIFPAALWPRIPEIFLGVKSGWHTRLRTPIAICEPSVNNNVGASTPHMGIHGLSQGQLYLSF
jgi:hypothetical protein